MNNFDLRKFLAENKHTIDRPYWFIDEMDLDDHLENMHNEWENGKKELVLTLEILQQLKEM